jgi:hypothetical protein
MINQSFYIMIILSFYFEFFSFIFHFKLHIWEQIYNTFQFIRTKIYELLNLLDMWIYAIK